MQQSQIICCPTIIRRNREVQNGVKKLYLWYGFGSKSVTLQQKERITLPRRGENIRKRKDGRWEARYPSGLNQKGNKTYSSVYGHTYREVKEKRQHVLNQNSLFAQTKESYTFKDVLQLWLEDNQIRLKEATI